MELHLDKMQKNGRPRINKQGSANDTEQKKEGNHFALDDI